MLNRFRTPKWLKQHLIDYKNFSDVPSNRLEQIKNGLRKYNSDNPTVSVVMPVWNEEKSLINTLATLADQQTKHSLELVIVNNNSTDRTQDIINYFGIKSIFQPIQSISLTRQKGLEAAKGKYHLCVDGDSFYPPCWIENMVNELQNENVSCVYAKHSFIPVRKNERLLLALHEIVAEFLFHLRKTNREYLNVLGFNFGFKTSDGINVGGFNTNRQRWSDGWMAMNLMKIGRLKSINNSDTRVWTSSRRLYADGSLTKAFVNRLKKEVVNIKEYLFNTPLKTI